MLSAYRDFREVWIGMAVHMVFGLLIMTGYWLINSAYLITIAIHTGLVAASFLALAGLIHIIFYLFGNTTLLRHLSALLIMLLSGYLLLNQISTAAIHIFWADQIRIPTIIAYIGVLPDLLGFTSIPTSRVYTLLSGATIACIAIHIYWYVKLLKAFQKPGIARPLPAHFKVALTSIVIIGIAFSTYAWLTSGGKLRGEPFADNFRTNTLFAAKFKPFSERFLDHQTARREYPFYQIRDLEKKNVILIMLDAARADHMSIYGYERETTPFLDSLYINGNITKVDFAASTCSNSECGIMGMLSSTFFSRYHPINFKLHDILWDAGYKTHFILGGDHSRAYRFLKTYYGASVDFFADGFDFDGRYAADDQGLLDKLDKVPDFEENGASFFYFHMMSTHSIAAYYYQYEKFTPSPGPELLDLLVKGRRGQANEEILL